MTIPSYYPHQTYLKYTEVADHLGKRMAAFLSIFKICLPRWLGIELYTEDHDIHHQKCVVNFSKRFTLWDRMLGTYSSVGRSTHSVLSVC